MLVTKKTKQIFVKAITKLSDFPWIMAIVLARCTMLFKLKVYGKII